MRGVTFRTMKASEAATLLGTREWVFVTVCWVGRTQKGGVEKLEEWNVDRRTGGTLS